MTIRRLTQLLSEGSDPDPRFTFANERTFLAWIRTSLALLAGGIGLEAFVADALPPLPRRALAALLIILGGVLAISAFTRWLASERALRESKPLPLPGLVPVLAAGIGVAALMLLAFVLVTG